MSMQRPHGAEQPYWPAGPFKIRLPFIHYRWEYPEMIQGLIMFVVGLAMIPLLQKYLGMPYEAALAFCVIAPLLDVAAKLAAENGVPVGQITAARFVVQTALMLPVILFMGLPVRLNLRALGYTTVRALFDEENQTYVLSGELATEPEVAEMADRPAERSPVGIDASGLVVSSEVESAPAQIEAVTELVAQMARAAEPHLVFENDTVTLTGNITQEGAEQELNTAIDTAQRAGLRVVDKTSEFDLAQQIDELDKKIKQALERAQEEALENDIGGEQAFFEFASATLSPVGRTVLDRVGVSLKQYPLPAVMIVGHTDSVGKPDTNLLLSESRAQVAAAYLINSGARSADKLSSLGRGEKDLDVPELDETTLSADELASRQRRIEFLIGQAKVDAMNTKNEAGS